MHHLKTALGLALMLALTGCYSFRSSVPSHIKTLAIPVFQNDSVQPGLEDDVTRAVIDRFQRNNALRIVDLASADAVLEGAVESYDNKVYRFNEREQADEYIVSMTFKVRVKDRIKNKDLWSEDALSTSATYQIGGPQARTEADARTEAYQRLADILVSKTVEGW